MLDETEKTILRIVRDNPGKSLSQLKSLVMHHNVTYARYFYRIMGRLESKGYIEHIGFILTENGHREAQDEQV